MKHLRKCILTLLALTLFGGAGAWAQEEVLLTTVTATSVTTYDVSTPGIVTVSLDNISSYNGAWGWGASGSVTVEAAQGYTITRCVFKQNPSGTPNRVLVDDLAPFTATMVGNLDGGTDVSATTTHGDEIGDDFMAGISTIEVYGYAAAQEIELTKAGANQWTLGQTPDYDLELQVEYYEAHALKEIPAGWQVMVNGIDKTAAIDGDSLMITETDSVTLVPAGNPRRVKSVTLEDEAPALQSLQVGGVFPGTFYYLPGETWEQALQNHPTENNGWSTWYIYVLHGDYYLEYTNDSYVNHTDPIDPTAGYLTE